MYTFHLFYTMSPTNEIYTLSQRHIKFNLFIIIIFFYANTFFVNEIHKNVYIITLTTRVSIDMVKSLGIIPITRN